MTKKIKKEVQVILKEKLENFGPPGSFLTVRAGYARNYLIPQQIANLATPTALKEFLFKQKENKKQEEQLIQNCLNQKTILEKIGEFQIQKRIGEENKIFGKVTKKQILEVFEQKIGSTLNLLEIEIPEIKEIGTYDVKIQLHKKIDANVKIKIVAQ